MPSKIEVTKADEETGLPGIGVSTMDPYEYEKNWGDSFDDLGPEYWEDYLGGPDFEDEDDCCRDEDDEFCEYECEEDDEDSDEDEEDDDDEEQDDEMDCEEIEKRQVMIVRWLTGG